MRKQNWNEIEEKEGFDSPTPGGYIARIDRVEDNEVKEYLKIEWDFADGAYKGHNRDTFIRASFWPITLYRSYKSTALSFFKAFKTALEESNPGYRFDEDNLAGMEKRFIGIVLGEEEYIKNDGTLNKRLYVSQTRSLEAIRNGDFKVPPLKKLAGASAQTPSPSTWPTSPSSNDDDGSLPF